MTAPRAETEASATSTNPAATPTSSYPPLSTTPASISTSSPSKNGGTAATTTTTTTTATTTTTNAASSSGMEDESQQQRTSQSKRAAARLLLVSGVDEKSAASVGGMTTPNGRHRAGPNIPGAEEAGSNSLQDVALALRHKVLRFLESEPRTGLLRDVQSQVRTAMRVVGEALDRYSPNELSLSYNGGKDCLVLLLLILATLPAHFPRKRQTPPTPSEPPSSSSDASSTPPSEIAFPTTLQAVYILSAHPFPEVDAFVEATARQYHLDLSRCRPPMRRALDEYLAGRRKVLQERRRAGRREGGGANGKVNGNGKAYRNGEVTGEAEEEEAETEEEAHEEVGKEECIKAIFVGTRRTDPHGTKLTHFDPTDAGWPSFVRVHPVIDWHYAEIWAFIRAMEVPYCPLYDLGYTSLGGTTDTLPNPALRVADDGFRPAYELVEDQAERLGRER